MIYTPFITIIPFRKSVKTTRMISTSFLNISKLYTHRRNTRTCEYRTYFAVTPVIADTNFVFTQAATGQTVGISYGTVARSTQGRSAQCNSLTLPPHSLYTARLRPKFPLNTIHTKKTKKNGPRPDAEPDFLRPPKIIKSESTSTSRSHSSIQKTKIQNQNPSFSSSACDTSDFKNNMKLKTTQEP